MDLALNTDTDDLATLDGDLFLVDADAAVAQRLKTKLRLFRGEWFLAQNAGIPYHDEVFVKNPRLAVLDALFKTEIIGTDGVVELVRFDMSLDGTTRVLSLSFEVRTTEGGILEFDEDLGTGGGGGNTGGGLMGEAVEVTFTNETLKEINVAVFGFNAYNCDVVVLDTLNNYRTEELLVSRPSSSLIRLESGLAITKTFRVLIDPITE